LLFDGFSFHSPTNGSCAAHNVPVTAQSASSKRKLRFDIEDGIWMLLERIVLGDLLVTI
jgi:hypothetical protein